MPRALAGETSETSGAEKEKSPLSYADWMRSVTTMAVEMEVNTQLGEFTVRKNRLKALQRSVKDMPDFHAALGATLAAQQSGGDAGGTSFGDPRGAGRGAEVDDTFFSGSSPSLGGLVSAGVDGGGADDDPDGAGYDSDGAASRDGSSGVSERPTCLTTPSTMKMSQYSVSAFEMSSSRKRVLLEVSSSGISRASLAPESSSRRSCWPRCSRRCRRR